VGIAPQQKGALIGRGRLRQAIEIEQRVAEPAMGLREVGLERDAALEMLERDRRLMGGAQADRQVGMGIGRVRRLREDATQNRQRLVVLALARQQAAEVAEHAQVMGRNLMRRPQCGDRIVDRALLHAGRAQRQIVRDAGPLVRRCLALRPGRT
jgi:hypothetical protein